MLALLETLETLEHEPRVLESLGFAFAHLDEPRGITPLSAIAHHPSERVRSAVAHALLGHEHDLAVRTLLELSGDTIDEVRDWATLDFLDEYEGPMLDSALLILADHLDDPRLREAIAERWPHGVPADARDQADADWDLASTTRV
ncbi:hypothetical protein OJ998_04420 [Solirubrobacter taibaiensis]|nr:hypothetical protein [Solirubrobacter taibaiensis]